ncbi:MAG: nucleotide exchange factor GrpE [FCB group bacterium]|nr:nucleotide exchange factor GrpE [FCB group bacterium]
MSAKKNTPEKKTTAGAQKTVSRKKTPVSKEKKVIKELTESLAQAEEKNLRIRAEFDNFRRRKEKEIQSILNYNGETILRELLPVVDDLERLAEAARGDRSDQKVESLIKGVELIQKRLAKQFDDWNLVSFAEPGDRLDPNLHDAMMVQTDPEKEDNTILQVFEKGYRYKDRVLRHAKVIVNKK